MPKGVPNIRPMVADSKDPINPWPATAPTTFAGGLAILVAMFGRDRPYSAGDLQVFAQVRFGLGRNRIMNRQHLQFLWAIEKRWVGVEQGRAAEAAKIARMEAACQAHLASVAEGAEVVQ